MRCILLKYDPDQPRDERGRFGEGNGGGSAPKERESTRVSVSTLSRASTASQVNAEIKRQAAREAKTSKLGGGKLREMDKATVLPIYDDMHKKFDSARQVDRRDGGVFPSMKWDGPSKAPSDWNEKVDGPFKPRAVTAKLGDFSPRGEYRPLFDVNEVASWRNQGEAGYHKAKVAMAELYAHAQARQGKVDDYVYGLSGGKAIDRVLEKNGLANAKWEVHHMLASGKGGSNYGKNLAILSAREHALAHALESTIYREYDKKGKVTFGTIASGNSWEEMGANREGANQNRLLKITAKSLSTLSAKGDKSFAARKAKAEASKSLQQYLQIAKAAGAVRSAKFNADGSITWLPGYKEKIKKYLMNQYKGK